MGNLLKVLSVFLLLGYSFAQIVEDIYDKNSTVITTRNVTAFTGKIIVKEINVDGPVSIACVNISDEDPEVSAYPSYVSGGIGHNYVEFNVQTTYGKGYTMYRLIHCLLARRLQSKWVNMANDSLQLLISYRSGSFN
ncbi:hypothetical protein YQE_09250, partial [Dendroctonus ponderosae]